MPSTSTKAVGDRRKESRPGQQSMKLDAVDAGKREIGKASGWLSNWLWHYLGPSAVPRD